MLFSAINFCAFAMRACLSSTVIGFTSSVIFCKPSRMEELYFEGDENALIPENIAALPADSFKKSLLCMLISLVLLMNKNYR